MKTFKNSETKQMLIISVAITLAIATFCFFISREALPFVIITSTLIIAVNIINIEYRYKKIQKISESIDKILHGCDENVISEFAEGELSVLCNEVVKMTARLRESKLALEKDKVFLTNSIADISHQLRTPLTSVNLLISSLSEKELEYEKRLRVMYDLKKLITRVDWLIETLLKISKIDAGTVCFEKETIGALELVKSACEPLSVSLDIRSQNVVYDVENLDICCDANWTAEAISNIIKNCMEHNPDGSSIYVSALKTNIYTQITIEDEGTGFEPNDLPRIFERFYKGKNDKSAGFGIGLSLARMIVLSQNGTIKAENRKSGGARFILKFYECTL